MAEESELSVIVYLRPQTKEAIAILDRKSNEVFTLVVAPPPEPSDIPLNAVTGPARGPIFHSTSIMSSITQAIHINHSTRGFVFGSRPDSNIKMGLSGDEPNYFRIHYNLDSGALLILAMEQLRIGTATLRTNESLLLMANTVIECGQRRFQFAIEFPDLTQRADEHKRNYRDYVKQLGIPDAPYLASFRLEDPYIGNLHKSAAILGKGAFGEVHKAVNIRDGNCVAIKVLTPGEELSSTQDQMNEVNALGGLSHANIIKYYGAFKFNGRICIQMELAANDLFKHWEARKGDKRRNPLSLECVRSIGRQALSALEYLHNDAKVHRDLKPQNILVTNRDPKTDLPTIKLADFGLASLKSSYDTVCGTLGWIAPEVVHAMRLLDEYSRQEPKFKTRAKRPKFRFESSVDIWALGMILKTLLRDIPSSRKIRGKMMPINKGPPMSLIDQMMRQVPKERPTATQCLNDPWMVSDDSYNLLTTKRELPLSPSQSSAQWHKRAH